jgi:hypothetical protein
VAGYGNIVAVLAARLVCAVLRALTNRQCHEDRYQDRPPLRPAIYMALNTEVCSSVVAGARRRGASVTWASAPTT